jgi:hypothetical protein
MKPHRGTLILILGILGCIFCGIFTAIPAWIMGNNDLKEMDAGVMDPSGRSITNVGRILGIVAVVLNILGIIVLVAAVALGLIAQPQIQP